MPGADDTLAGLLRRNAALQAVLGDPVAASAPVTAPGLDRALAAVDRVFGIDRVLADPSGQDVAGYYTLSEPGYRKMLSPEGAIHLALSVGGRVGPDDFARQAAIIAGLVAQTGARRVVELGCGRGFNLIRLARQFPGIAWHGLDLTPAHVAQARAAAAGLGNATFDQGRHEALPPDLGQADVIFAVETLCHATDRAAVLGGIARHLAPGGLFVMIDAVTGPDRAPARHLARRLYEAVTAVGPGFAPLADWQDACRGAGLTDQAWCDLTPAVRPGVQRLARPAWRYVGDWRLRLASRLLPLRLRRNAVGALLGPHLIDPEGPGDPTHTALRYGLLVARRQVAFG